MAIDTAEVDGNDGAELESISAATLKTELMQITLDELKVSQKPWDQLSSQEQSDCLDRLDLAVCRAIRITHELFVTSGKIHVKAAMDQVVVKDGIKLQLSLGRFDSAMHDVVDAQGQTVYVVLANPEQFTDAPHEQQPDPDQRELVE